MKKYRSDKDCLNCGTQVDDKFCPNCGQENLETREPFWSFLFHNLGHYFHFDSKFLKSFVPLITKPGQLTKEFIAGKRASHFPPFTLYLFISLVFFLFVLQDDGTAVNYTVNVDPKIQAEKIDSLKKVLQTGLTINQKAEIDKKIAQYSKDTSVGGVMIMGDQVKYRDITDYEKSQQALAENKRDSGLKRYLIKKELQINQKYGDRKLEVIKETVIHNVPKMMFILMPLFALLLSISFYKSRLYFMEHLVYTLHVHSFIFLLFTFTEILSHIWASAEETIIGLAVLVSIWYIYRSMRNVYGRGRKHILVKLFILGLFYMLLLMISLTLIILFSVASL